MKFRGVEWPARSTCHASRRTSVLGGAPNGLALDHIKAWRVLSLTDLNRIVPDISRTALFTDSEWKATWRVVKQQQRPKKPPWLGELMTLLACLGESNNRAKERPPGPDPIWVGIRRMIDFAIAWNAFGSESEHDVKKHRLR